MRIGVLSSGKAGHNAGQTEEHDMLSCSTEGEGVVSHYDVSCIRGLECIQQSKAA